MAPWDSNSARTSKPAALPTIRPHRSLRKEASNRTIKNKKKITIWHNGRNLLPCPLVLTRLGRNPSPAGKQPPVTGVPAEGWVPSTQPRAPHPRRPLPDPFRKHSRHLKGQLNWPSPLSQTSFPWPALWGGSPLPPPGLTEDSWELNFVYKIKPQDPRILLSIFTSIFPVKESH